MSRIVDDEPPIKSHPASKEYRDNWEVTFGEPARGCAECSGTGCVIDPDVDPAAVHTEGDLLKNCPHCNRVLDKHGICPDL